jgi:hypothetical protein
VPPAAESPPVITGQTVAKVPLTVLPLREHGGQGCEHGCQQRPEKPRATSSDQTDSGVTARVFGSLLTWLNDHESDVFFVGTCNDASKLPPEFARDERFDGVFFVDLPRRDQKDAIWGIYTRH